MSNTVYLRRFYPQIHADERRLKKVQQSFCKLVIDYICENLRPSADQSFLLKQQYWAG